MGLDLLSETWGLVEAPCRRQVAVLTPFHALHRVIGALMEDRDA